ncbi:MAG: hypothetical protein HYR66_03450 [Sphingobacteriales bacterium]|nr:hypothetical protein [Sphingobacteriales bacterium]MBI3720245.1 hypothetical protein [Sphingobacteriales bacterium]
MKKFLSLISSIVVCTTSLFAQSPKPKPKALSTKIPINFFSKELKLKDDPSPAKKLQLKTDSVIFIPKNFYIQSVEDNTGLKDSIGFVLQPKSGKPQKLIFEGGIAEGFKQYYNSAVKRDTTLYPMIVSIKKFLITEQREDFYDKGNIEYAIEFISNYKGKRMPASSYSGGGYLNTLLGKKKSYDSLFAYRESEYLEHVDEQMGKAIDEIPDFAKGTKINVTIADNNQSEDTIYFRDSRMLDWKDYRGSGDEDNQLNSGIMIPYEMEADYKNQYLIFNITIATAFVPSESYAGRNTRTATILNHEFYRFKLAHVYTLRLAKKFKALTLTTENARQEISKAYNEIYKALMAELKDYDNQTGFSRKKKEQVAWEDKIDRAMQDEVNN